MPWREPKLVAELSRGLSEADELDNLITIALVGIGRLFTGEAYMVPASESWPPAAVVGASGWVPWEGLSSSLQHTLAHDDGARVSVEGAEGISLTADRRVVRHRWWVEFPEPRPISDEEVVVAHLVADVLAAAVDRLQTETAFAAQAEHLRAAVKAHEKIGRAVGILMERHGVTSSEALASIKETSQELNVKVRDLAAQVVADVEGADVD